MVVRIPTRARIVSAEQIDAFESRRPIYPSGNHARLDLNALPIPGCVCGVCNTASLINNDRELPAMLRPQAQ